MFSFVILWFYFKNLRTLFWRGFLIFSRQPRGPRLILPLPKSPAQLQRIPCPSPAPPIPLSVESFPMSCKHAGISPWSETSWPHLPHQLLSLSLSTFTAKLLRRVVYTCWPQFLASASLLDPLQTAFHPHHFTETSIDKITGDRHVINPVIALLIYLTHQQHWTQIITLYSWKHCLSLASRTPCCPGFPLTSLVAPSVSSPWLKH